MIGPAQIIEVRYEDAAAFDKMLATIESVAKIHHRETGENPFERFWKAEPRTAMPEPLVPRPMRTEPSFKSYWRDLWGINGRA